MPSELKFYLTCAKKLKNESHILAILMNIQYVVEQVSISSTVKVRTNLIYFIDNNEIY